MEDADEAVGTASDSGLSLAVGPNERQRPLL